MTDFVMNGMQHNMMRNDYEQNRIGDIYTNCRTVGKTERIDWRFDCGNKFFKG